MWAQLTLLAGVDELARCRPRAGLAIYVVDANIDLVAATEGECAELTCAAVNQLVDIVEAALGGVIAVAKAAIIAFSPSLTSVVRSRLGPHAGPPRDGVVTRGVDFGVGRPRGKCMG